MLHVRVFPALLIAAAIGTGMGHAAHISMDSVFGPGTITRDTNTGLEWLDLRKDCQTYDCSFDPGDWRIATYSEWSAFTAPYFAFGPNGPVDFAAAQAFVALVGATNPPSTRGFFDPTDSFSGNPCFEPGEPCEIYVMNLYIFSSDAEVDVQRVNFPSDPYDGAGIFYVRTAIPEPSTLWLLCGGLAVLLAVRATKAYRRVFRG